MITDIQRQQLLQLKAQGLTKEQAIARVFGAKTTPTTQPESRFGDVREDIVAAGRGVVSDISQRATNIREGFAAGMRGEQTPLETGAQMAGNILGGAGDIAFRGAQAAVTPFLKESEERAIETGVTSAIEKTGIPQAIQEASPRTQRNIIGGLGLLEGATAGLSTAGVKSATKSVSERIGKFLGRTPEPVAPRVTPEQIISKTETRLQQIANDPNLSAREKEAAAQSALTIKEKWAGVTPDVKKRIQEMEPGTLEKYFDQAHLRNVDDTALSPYALGAQRANDAIEGLNNKLRETGGVIGSTRQKLSTVQMPQPSVSRVENAFTSELDKLNLTIRNGQVVTVPGKIAKTASNSDISAIQDLYNDLLKYKQSPTLANAIDLRMKFDGKIKFGQSAREVSNSVDPLSRSTRSALAEEAAKSVGKQNAAELQRYSDFMEAYADLKSYTDRAAGGEYLLRLVLSGRGGEAQKLIQTVKDYTGIDLMNDATAMKLATEIVGGDAQKNLFRQEATKAGLDAAKLFTGDVKGFGAAALQKLAEYGINEEDVYRAIAAGAGGYLIATYTDTDGMLPAGVAVLAAMPSGARKQALKQAEQIAKSTGKTIKLSDADKDAVLQTLQKTDMGKIQQPNQMGGSTIDFEDVDELDRLKAQMETDGGLSDLDYVEAKALLDKYNVSFNQGATPQTTALLEEAKKFTEKSVVKEAVFHGTDANFETFKIGKQSASGVDSPAIFLTNDKSLAYEYGKNVREVYIDLQDPVTFDFDGKSTIFFDGKWRTPSDLSKRIKELDDLLAKGQGLEDMLDEIQSVGSWKGDTFRIDGIVMENINDSSGMFGNKITTNYAIFDPKKIKEVNNR